MLKSLSVKDFAIIEDLTVNFKEGMTVLTGETGAGKSLIIDTISLLLGARADSDMIRYGKTLATITGVFTYQDKFASLFNSLGIEINEDIVIERSISFQSKNQVKINNTLVTLNTLKTVAKMLADIHVQNDTYKLFNQEEYLSFLDPKSDKNFDKLIDSYIKSLLSKYLCLQL